MSIEAMKQALEALEYPGPSWPESREKTAQALRQAISEAEKQDVEQSSTESKETFDQPVAWMSSHDVGFKRSEFGDTPTVPLYTTPLNPMDSIKSSNTLDAQPQREWVGLTDEDEIDWDGGDLKSFVKAIEAKLKEKNQ